MLRLRTFGAIDLRDSAGNPVTGLLQQPSRLGLLVYLAAARSDGFLRRDHLLPLFWAELDETRGRAALSQALHVIRRTLGQAVVVTRGTEEVRLDRDQLGSDIEEFLHHSEEAGWDSADRLYRGEFLPSFHLSDSPEFEQWLEETRGSLRERARAGATRMATQEAAAGHGDQAIRWARRVVDLAPLDEPANRRLMELLAAQGNRTGAVQAYEDFAALLARELELTPSGETRALLDRVRIADPIAARPPVLPAAAAPAESFPAPALPTALPPRRSRWSLVGWAALLLLAPAAGLFLLSAGAHRVRARQYPRVAVFPFVVHGDTGLTYLGDGMVDLVSTKLEAIGPVRTVDPGTLLARLGRTPGLRQDDPGALAQVATELDADLFVVGRIVGVGQRISLSLSLYDQKGERQTIVSEDAAEEAELPAAVDRAVTDLAASRWSAPAERLERLAIGSTTIQPALKAYLEGARRFRVGDYARARDAFHRAIEADSLYAIAWYRLSTTAAWLGDVDDYLEGAHRAATLADRLSDRDRRLVQAHRAYVDGAIDESESLYRGLVGEYPDDAEAWYQLGEVLFHTSAPRGRAMETAGPAFTRAEALIGGSTEAMGHLIALAVLDRDVEAADSLLPKLLATFPPGEPRRLYDRLLVAVLHGNKAPRRAILAELPRGDASTLWIAAQAVATYTNDFETADTIATWLTGPGNPTASRVQGLVLQLELRLAAGRWREAREIAGRIGELDPATGSEMLALCDALPWVRLGPDELERARAALAKWGRPNGVTAVGTPGGAPLLHAGLRDYFGVLLGLAAGDSAAGTGALERLHRAQERSPEIREAGLEENARAAVALSQGGVSTALALLEELSRPVRKSPSMPGLSLADERYRRAQTLRALRRHGDALGWYRSFRVIFEGDLRFRGPALLGEAEALEAIGQPAPAREAYQTFLDIWAGSDPRFERLLVQARARAAELGRTEVR